MLTVYIVSHNAIIIKEANPMTNNSNEAKPILIGVDDVCMILGIKPSRAYSVIRQLNAQLKAQGKITINGRINKQFLLDNFSV